MPTASQQPHRLRARPRASRRAAVQHQRLGDLPAHRHHRVQRRHRLLEHHGDRARRAAPARRRRGWPSSSRPAKRIEPPTRPGARHQPHQRQRGDALAAAALADHAQRAAGSQRVGDARDHLARATRRTRNADAQVARPRAAAASFRHASPRPTGATCRCARSGVKPFSHFGTTCGLGAEEQRQRRQLVGVDALHLRPQPPSPWPGRVRSRPARSRRPCPDC